MRRLKEPCGVDELRRLIDYDPNTGLFVWKSRTPEDFPRKEQGSSRREPELVAKIFNAAWAGKPVFTTYRVGYLVGSINGHRFAAHRVAWAMCNGEWPPDGMEVDHIDGVRSNNAISNLRLCTPKENSRNKRLSSINRSGFSGVCWSESRQRWEASINGANGAIHLGSYHTKEEAVAARGAAEKVLGYSKRHGRAYGPIYPEPKRSRARSVKNKKGFSE